MHKTLIIMLTLALALSCSAWKVKSTKKLTKEGEWASPAFSPDGTKFFALNGKRQICLFDAAGTLLTIKENVNIGVPCWSPDSKLLAAEVESSMQPIAVLSAEDLSAKYLGEKVFKPCWAGDSKSLYCIFWKKDHGMAISKLKELNLSGGVNELFELPKNKDGIKSVAASPKEAKVAFSYNQGGAETAIYIVNTEESEKKKLADGLKGEIVNWSPDGKTIWTGEELVEVEEKRAEAEGMPFAQLATWSKDSKWLFYSKENGQDGELARYDILARKEEVLKTKDFESGASFSPDGLTAVCIDGKDGNLLLIKLAYE